MGTKTNPRRRPASWEDVTRAWQKGVLDGCSNASAIFLTVLVDKFDGEDKVADVWKEIVKLSDEVKERRVSVADLRTTLREEYGVIV